MAQDDQLVGDYGIDAPGIVRGVAYLAVGLLGVAVVAAAINIVPLMVVAFVLSALTTLFALVLVRSSRVGKLRERELLFDRLGLADDAVVLDVGCGRGLLLVEAARRLPDGLAVGIDIWRHQDQSDNYPEAPIENAELEGVDDTVAVQTADARRMPFRDGAFDAVVSSMALHNLRRHGDRAAAIREIDRVLKPRGRLVLVDCGHSVEYVRALRSCKWTNLTRSRRTWRLFPPVRYIEGRKPVERRRAAAPAAEHAEQIEPVERVQPPEVLDERPDEPDAPEEKPQVPVV